MSPLIKLDPWYITGLCEGVASFTYSRTGLQSFVLYFAIKLKSQDKKILEGIQDFFGCGRIYSVKQNNGQLGSDIYYRVTKISDLEKVVRHFDQYPLKTKKAKNYQLWREMVFLKKENFGKPSYKQLDDLVKKLSKEKLEG